MKNKVFALAVMLLLITGGLIGIHHKPVPKPAPNPIAICHINGQLPDATCTPGVTNPNVTQANIKQTICVTGWTATIRPSQSYTHQLKVQGIKNYGYKDTNLAHYEEDHLISLELGGSPTDPKNLWPEPGASPNPKDGVESSLRVRVCNGTMTLQSAQTKIAQNWQTALK